MRTHVPLHARRRTHVSARMLLCRLCPQFEEVQLKEALNTVGVSNGLAVRPPDPASVQFKIFVRGMRMQEVRNPLTARGSTALTPWLVISNSPCHANLVVSWNCAHVPPLIWPDHPPCAPINRCSTGLGGHCSSHAQHACQCSSGWPLFSVRAALWTP
jgi:hypothetical protein